MTGLFARFRSARRMSATALALFMFAGELSAQHPRVDSLFVPKQTGILNPPDGFGPPTNPSDNYSEGPIPATLSSVKFYIKTHRGWDGTTVSEELQMFITVTDAAATQVKIDLDFNHTNVGTTVRRRRITINKNPAAINAFDISSGTQVALGTVIPSANLRSSQGPPWTLEFQVRAADLLVDVIPDLVGMYMEVNTTKYPFGATQGNLDSWAHLRTRRPADFAMLLDQSGSMTSMDGQPESRWTRAKRATDMMAAALAIFHEPRYNDRISVAQFSWACSGADRTDMLPPAPVTWTAITTTPTRIAAGASGPLSDNCTPIQRGLDFAIKDQGGSNATLVQDRDRIVVLLSDGLHNRPTINFDHSAFDNVKLLAEVMTVAMLPDGDGGTLLLDQIAGEFRKPAFAARYNNVIHFGDLLGVYLKPLESLFGVNFVPKDLSDGRFRPGQPDKLVFIGAWNTANQASALTIEHKNTAGTVTTGLSITPIVDNITGYAAAVVGSPPAGGSWAVTGQAGTTAPDHIYLLADLRGYAQFFVDQRPYSAGDPILLIADLRDEGRPVKGADVTFTLDRPGMGLGDFLTTLKSDCTFGRPTPPAPMSLDSVRLALSRRSMVAPLSLTGGGGGSGDPLPGRYQIAASNFERCGRDRLARAEDDGIRLRDDGVSPDVVKDDGVYSYALMPPEEGSYNIRFQVSAQSSDGIPFRRTHRLSEFARITPTADATELVIQKVGVVAGRQVTHVVLLFRDRMGNYLGTGFPDLFEVRVVGAQLLEPLSDLGTGYYRLTLDYAANGPDPLVSVGIPGTAYHQDIDLSPGPSRAFAASLHAGVSVPHGSFGTSLNTGFGITADLAYHLPGRPVDLELLAGYHRFGGAGTSPDAKLFHLSGSGKLFLTQGRRAAYVEAGIGAYDFSPGPTDAGVHAGAGVQFNLWPRAALEGLYRLHSVFTSGSNSTFSSIQVGGRVRF